MASLSKAARWALECSKHPVLLETISHFAATPSMAAHLQNKNYECIPTSCRTLKPDGEDNFFAKTLASPDAIPHFLTLLRSDFCSQPLPTSTSTAHATSDPDTITLITFGGRDLVGHPTIVHGGVSTALLDEAMSFVLSMYQIRMAGDTPKNSTFTLNINVNFRAAVSAPGQVVIECRLGKVEGRKYFVQGVMKDLDGKVLVEASSLWLSERAAHL